MMEMWEKIAYMVQLDLPVIHASGAKEGMVLGALGRRHRGDDSIGLWNQRSFVRTYEGGLAVRLLGELYLCLCRHRLALSGRVLHEGLVLCHLRLRDAARGI